jgi:hypothetical protein
VVVAHLVGIALLTMPVVSHHSPHGRTVAAFAVLTGFSVLSLVLLGTQLFNIFGPASLSLSLPRRFHRGLQDASASEKAVPEEAQQQAARHRAARVLHIYRQLSELVGKRAEVTFPVDPPPLHLIQHGVRSPDCPIYSSSSTKLQ